MAVIYPSIEGVHASSGGQARELQVVRLLAAELPHDFAIFHGALFSAMRGEYQMFGEIDVIVLAPSAAMAILEVKAGSLEFSGTAITKRYADKVKDITQQVKLQYNLFRQRLKEAKLRTPLVQFLVAPDAKVGVGTLAYPRERIIDCDDMSRMTEYVLHALGKTALVERKDELTRATHLLNNVFELAADPSARIGWLHTSVRQLSEGLATWVLRIRSPSQRYVIHATAGSGKTQLAVRLFADAIANARTVRYVCFNRPLAEHMRHTLQATRDQVTTFHELAVACLRQTQDAALDFSNPEVFKQAEQCFCQQVLDDADWDVVLIDEAQDFSAAWVQALLQRVRLGGQVYVLMDEAQALYQRAQNIRDILTNAVEISSWDNFRTPRRAVQIMNALRLTAQPIVARSPIDGHMPAFHPYPPDDHGGIKTLERLLRKLNDKDIALDHIAILSFAGRERSEVLKQETLADWKLRRFTGQYDAQGLAIWSEGELLADTLHRFKGQAAPVVILCEVDFTELDDKMRHRLFVGMSRAQWRLEIVLSQQAEKALVAELKRE
ncbi:MAG: ATP-binding domain-containing protein [Halothiobacillaceae bacterium]